MCSHEICSTFSKAKHDKQVEKNYVELAISQHVM